jgi:hypothetical protein
MKKILLFLPIIALLGSCSSGGNQQQQYQQPVQVNVTQQQPQVNVTDEDAAGLDLQAAGTLAYQVFSSGGTAEDFQRKLNEPNGINNMDLNNDGKTDFLAVTEARGAGNVRKFIITDHLPDGPTEVATISADHSASQGTLSVNGNPGIYGSQPVYQSSFTLGDAAAIAAFAYLWGPRYHPIYVSPYSRYGYYPTYYGSGYSRLSPRTYTERVQTVRTVKTVKYVTPASSTTTASSWKTASSAKSNVTAERTSYRKARSRNFANATTSQRSFTSRDQNKSVGSGGFGKSTSSSSSSSNTKSSSWFSKPSSNSSSRSFGSSRSGKR